MKQENEVKDFLLNELISNKKLFDQNVYNVIFKKAFSEFDGRKIIVDAMFGCLKNEFPQLKDYFFKFYAEYINRIGKMPKDYSIDEFVSYIYKIYVEWREIKIEIQDLSEGEKQDLSEVEKIAKKKGIIIRNEIDVRNEVDQQVESSKKIPMDIDQSVKSSKKILIEKDDKKKYGKLNLKRIKTHGAGKIFNFDEFKNRQVSGLDFEE